MLEFDHEDAYLTKNLAGFLKNHDVPVNNSTSSYHIGLIFLDGCLNIEKIYDCIKLFRHKTRRVGYFGFTVGYRFEFKIIESRVRCEYIGGEVSAQKIVNLLNWNEIDAKLDPFSNLLLNTREMINLGATEISLDKLSLLLKPREISLDLSKVHFKPWGRG